MIREQYLNSILKDSATVAAWDFGPCTLDSELIFEKQNQNSKSKSKEERAEQALTAVYCVSCINDCMAIA
jgi:hypothetical protein